ncbi:MAG TPA: YdcF family protein [Pyrinomonadaceae bacterium]|nr:YdcF family protein [Pyrinomonadaceae bacterium]
MLLRNLIVSIVLSANSFIPHAVLYSSAFQPTYNFTTIRPAAQGHDATGFDSGYRLSLSKPVQDKNFYLLSLFQRDPDVRRLLRQDKTLNQLASVKVQSVENGGSCDDVRCFDRLIRLDTATVEAVAAELQKLANEPQLKRLAKNDLRPSGAFIKYRDQTDAQMLVSAWKDAAAGLNRILTIYCLGKDPRYKEIDRVSFDVSADAYRKLMKTEIEEITHAHEPLFFEPTLNFAIKLLEINRRDEAARYEPLEDGVNKAAVRNLTNIKWSNYPYSFILVLGSGPSDSARLSATGARRADVGAQLFLQHKAPLIILSGGHVHPMQTPYCEAIEMKKYLMEKYQIAETSILVEPQARHTTTNFRNAARLVFRYRIPADRMAVVTSSEDHITATTSEAFRLRCLNELGYFPVEFIKRTSPVEAEFKPAAASLFFDANDPLDP